MGLVTLRVPTDRIPECDRIFGHFVQSRTQMNDNTQVWGVSGLDLNGEMDLDEFVQKLRSLADAQPKEPPVHEGAPGDDGGGDPSTEPDGPDEGPPG